MKTYVDLFSGCGGLSLGFDSAGYKNVFSLEYNPEIATTYNKNFPNHNLIVKDITELDRSEILNLVGGTNVDIVIGGPPCQGFSMAGNIGRRFVDDERNYLFKEFVRFVDIIRPKAFLFENVARIERHNNGETLEEILSAFSELGYHCNYKVILSSDYGVPQHRRRLFIIGHMNQFIDFPTPENIKKSVEEAIGDLPILKSGEDSNIPNHTAMKHSDDMLNKMSYITDGGNRKDIPEEIRPKSGDARKYIRYKSSEPSFCITGDMRKVFHYNQNRALSVRELARLQTFPDSFIFHSTSTIVNQQMIGNAVPPLLAFKIADKIGKVLDK
jgi:DNA (cytosine-5)-methyltransferase 1